MTDYVLKIELKQKRVTKEKNRLRPHRGERDIILFTDRYINVGEHFEVTLESTGTYISL